MRISDWSSDVCSSDLIAAWSGTAKGGFKVEVDFARQRFAQQTLGAEVARTYGRRRHAEAVGRFIDTHVLKCAQYEHAEEHVGKLHALAFDQAPHFVAQGRAFRRLGGNWRPEEHTYD